MNSTDIFGLKYTGDKDHIEIYTEAVGPDFQIIFLTGIYP
jgi:hypothetical protein